MGLGLSKYFRWYSADNHKNEPIPNASNKRKHEDDEEEKERGSEICKRRCVVCVRQSKTNNVNVHLLPPRESLPTMLVEMKPPEPLPLNETTDENADVPIILPEEKESEKETIDSSNIKILLNIPKLPALVPRSSSNNGSAPSSITSNKKPANVNNDSGIEVEVDINAQVDNDDTSKSPDSDSICNVFEKKSKWMSKDFIRNNKIAKGGFSNVYKASIKGHPGITVALKVVTSSTLRKLNDNDNEKENCPFLSEFQLHHSLKHPNIVQALAFYKQPRSCVMVMEFCKYDLQEYISNFNTKERSLQYIKQLGTGIRYLHLEAKLIHMDLKLENVLISTNDLIKITDFGFAMKITGDLRTRYLKSRGGTRWYKAPEQLNQMSFDSTVDIWAYGCIVYELIFTNHPFFSTDKVTDSYCSEKDQPVAIGRMLSASRGNFLHDKELSEESPNLRILLDSVLTYSRHDRASAKELGDLLEWLP